MSAAIGKYLLGTLVEEDINKLSAKSLCQVSITQLSVHKATTIIKACACSWHSTGSTLEYHIDKKNPEEGLPAANVIYLQADLF